jgi:glycosyltransferase involved in cell wall biosynthesis
MTAPALHLAGGLMIAWKSECYRSSATARIFGVPLHLMPRSKTTKTWQKVLSYPGLMAKTLSLLLREKPQTVLCLNLPPFLPLVCALYALTFRANFVMDFHSGALTKAAWIPFRPLYRLWTQRAPFTICHNRADGAVIARWKGRPVHLLTLPQDRFPDLTYSPRQGRPLMLFSCSFADDEPVDLALEAMRACPEYDFVISGNYKKRGIDPAREPRHIHFAGFLEYRRYLEIMAEATALITLSDRPHIMQMAVHEALTLGTPVVTNESPVLREVLAEGGVFAALEAPALVAAFGTAVRDHELLASAMKTAKRRAFGNVAEELATVCAAQSSLFAATQPASQ